MSDSRILAYMAHRKAAIVADKSQNPAEIRRHTISQLYINSTSEEMPPAQRIKALELLGKITEVALFTERREVIRVTDASQAKAQLLDALRDALRRNSITVNDTSRDALTIDAQPTPPVPAPLNAEQVGEDYRHSIPDIPPPSPGEPTPSQNGSPDTWEDISTSQIENWTAVEHAKSDEETNCNTVTVEKPL